MAKISKVTRIKLETPEPAYDLQSAMFYENYAIAISQDTGIFSHNCGKSAAMLQDCLNAAAVHDKSILWLAMGDLTRFDFLTRSLAVLTGLPYTKVIADFKTLYTPDIREVMSKMDLIAVPSKKISAEGFLELINSRGKRYDIVVADYDSNFKREESGNMYDDGGVIYDILTEIARPVNEKARIVFVAAQPKVHYWECEKIPKEGAGESSRKQHIVDMMITMGKKDSEYPCGIMFMAKCRRGKEGSEVPWKMSENGRIDEIERDLYSRMGRFGK